ncbi:MAG: HD-GYP domain-containing protein [Chloroflexi bacterium]|nr:HD-GYP domain-containing protein [Chloroflexota bacterium]
MGRGLGPVGRFSVALATVLALTAAAVALATGLLMGRYVEEQTAEQTRSAVEKHFGTVFAEDVFMRPLSNDESAFLQMVVAFHFTVYDIVATRFYGPDGAVVFSYDPNDIGERPQDPQIWKTIGGATASERETIFTDGRSIFGYGTDAAAIASGEHAHAATAASASAAPTRMVSALGSWIPVRFPDGIRGAVVVWRDMAKIDEAVRSMQLMTSAIMALSAVLLWFVLRGVYARSSHEIRRRSLELAAALAETEKSYDATLGALSNALDVRDSETEGHARRVVVYLDLVAQELNVPIAERATLLRGALLHDIGKIGVADDILRKVGPLSTSEWTAMRRHPSYGARILAGVPYLSAVAAIIRHHHERWDGTGYPDGLRGDEIPLGARMFAVADAFDAMTSDRPYRRALDPVSARAEILAASGTQFDPAVVEVFMELPLSKLLEVAPGGDAPVHALGVA